MLQSNKNIAKIVEYLPTFLLCGLEYTKHVPNALYIYKEEKTTRLFNTFFCMNKTNENDDVCVFFPLSYFLFVCLVIRNFYVYVYDVCDVRCDLE